MEKARYSNQEIVALLQYIDNICLTCKHRWESGISECSRCRFSDRKVFYEARDKGTWEG